MTATFSQTVTRTTENDSSRLHEPVKQYDARSAIHSEKLWAILVNASKIFEEIQLRLSTIAQIFSQSLILVNDSKIMVANTRRLSITTTILFQALTRYVSVRWRGYVNFDQ